MLEEQQSFVHLARTRGVSVPRVALALDLELSKVSSAEGWDQQTVADALFHVWFLGSGELRLSRRVTCPPLRHFPRQNEKVFRKMVLTSSDSS